MLPTPSRLFPSRRHPGILRRDVDLLSFDVFGLALRRMLLRPDDLHVLVGTIVADGDERFERSYPQLRALAEEQARSRQGDQLRIADIADELEALLAGLDPAGGAERARRAIRSELEVEQLICRPDPDALALYHEAGERGVPVAFVSDSYLPRDLVARILERARYRAEHVLVSSNEGETKATGLLGRLPKRTGMAAERIVHLGPDPVDDVERAAGHGIRSWAVSPGRESVEARISLGLSVRSGLDSIGLALAADRLASVEADMTPGDLGYVAGGPLVCGFAIWVARLIAVEDPDHVVLHGPTVGHLDRLITLLGPEPATGTIHRFEPTAEPDSERAPGPESLSDQLDRFGTAIGIQPGDRVLSVDLGWNRAPGDPLVKAWDLLHPDVAVIHAFLGSFSGVHLPSATRTWAFGTDPLDPVSPVASERIEVIEALVNHTGRGALAALPEPARSELVAGIDRYAEDLRPWLDLGQRRCTAALAEPALRLMVRPDPDEAAILADVPTRVVDADGRPLPLSGVVSPGPGDDGHDDDLSVHAVWPAGHQVLAGSLTRPAGRLPRRFWNR